MSAPLALSLSLSLLLAGCLSAEATERLGKSPHGAKDGCAACHVGVGAPGVGATKPIEATCRSCHPDADMHPVGMKPRTVKVAAGWPLEDGVVTCATCHAEPAHGGAAATLPSPWHRGGPYPTTTAFCASCHDIAAYSRQSPHTKEKTRDPKGATCTACHSGLPVTGAAPSASRTRVPADQSCTGCHEGQIHAGVVEHVGKSVSPAVRAALPPAVAVNADGTIACWTCHEVHDGVTATHPNRRVLADGLRSRALKEDWTAYAGSAYLWPRAEADEGSAMLALSIDDGALCQACHGEGP